MSGICAQILFIIIRIGGGAFGGFISLVVGHAILRAADVSPYNEHQYSLESSMKLGALGGTLMTFPLIALEYLIGKIQLPEEPAAAAAKSEADEEAVVAPVVMEGGAASSNNKQLSKRALSLKILQLFLYMGTTVAFGTGAGAIGSAVLRSAHPNSDTFLPTLYAARAGCIASAILGPGSMTVVLVFAACCTGLVGGPLILATRGLRRDFNGTTDVDKAD